MIKKQKPSINGILKFFSNETKDDKYLLEWYNKYSYYYNFPDNMIKFISFEENASINQSKLKSIEKNRIYLEKPQNFNDPFDGKYYIKYNNTIIKEENKINTKKHEVYRVCCFQSFRKKNPMTNSILTNPQMWSHYANWHNGICIQYYTDFVKYFATDPYGNFDMLKKENNLDYACRFFPMRYEKNMPFINIDEYNRRKNKDDYIKQTVLKSIITKSKKWKEEDEYRLIVNIEKDKIKKENGNYFYKAPPIKKIYLGVNLDKDIEKRLIKIANEKYISLEKLIIKKDCYELDIDCNNKRINELKNNLMLKEVFDKFKPNNAL